MKSAPHSVYYTTMTYVWGLIAIVAFGASLIFVGFGETTNCLWSLVMGVLTSAMSMLYREIGKPKNWSNSDTRGIYRIR